MLPKIPASVLALLLLLTLPAFAQLDTDPMLPEVEAIPLLSFEQVLRSYYEAIGGEDAWTEVESFEMTGTMQMGPGMIAPFTVYSARHEQMRLEFVYNGMTGIQVINGDEAWMVMPFMGKTTPEDMPEDMVKSLEDLLDMEGALVNFTDKGHTLEYLGPGQVQGTDVYKIKATLASGTEQIFSLDSDEFVPIALDGKSTSQGNEIETKTTLSDYKAVNGLMIPHSMETRIEGQPGSQVITIEEIEVDADLSEIEFEKPEIEGSEAAE